MQPHFIETQREEEDRPKPNWKRRILIAAACLLGLLIVGWRVISSEMFLRGVVLKKAGKAIHAEISFESADWSPRRSVVLRGVRMKAVGQEPCLEAKEITVNFELGDLLAGKINLDDITLVEPVVSVHMDAEGNTNLDPFFDKSGKPGKPAQVDIGRFVLQRGVLNFHRLFHSGNEERMTIRHLDMRGENIGNKRAGKLNITAGVQYALHRAGVEVADKLEGTLSLECGQELGLNWFPESITARAKVLINKTRGQFAFANGLVVNLKSRLTPTELEDFQINFQHEGNPIGNLLLSGPIDFQNGAAELKVAVNGIERRVLNFVGRPHDLEFHETVLSSTNRLAISALGRQIELRGSVIGTPINTSLGRVSFPSVDLLEVHYDFTMDLEGKHAVFDALRVRAVQQDKEFLKGQINQPMTLVWGGDSIEAPDSRFELAVANTDVADWQPWLGRYAKSGAVKARAEIRVKNNGREVRVDSSGSISGFQLPVNGKVIRVGDFDLNATGQIIGFNKLEFTQLKAEVGRPDKVFFKYEGKPVVNLKTKVVMDTNGKLEGELPILLSWFPQKGMSCETGRVTYNGTLTAKLNQPRKQTVAGTVHWENVNGVIKTHKLDRLAGTADLDLELEEGHQLRINRFVADATVGGQPLFSKISLGGLWDLRDGLVDLEEVLINGLDLSLLKFTVPMKGVSAGMLDVHLETLGHEPGSKTIAKKVVAKIRKGVVAGWPMDLNLDGAGDVEMTWLGKGDFKMRGSIFDLKSLSKGDASRSDAQLKGDVFFNKSTGVIQVDLKSSHWDYPFLNSMLMKRLGAVELLDAKIIQVEPISFKSDGKGSFEIKGPIRVERFRLKDPEGLLPKGQLAANLNMNILFAHNPDEWSINDCNATASLFWEDLNAGQVILKGNYLPQSSAGAFDVTIKDVDHHIVSLLPKRWTDGAQMRSGRISILRVEGTIKDQKLKGSLNVELKGADIRLKNGFWPAGQMDVEYELMDAELSFGGDQFGFKAKTNNLNIKQNGVEVASFDMKTSVKDSAKTFSIKSLDLKPPFTSLGLKKWLPKQSVKAGRLTINESELRLDPKGNGHFKGNIQFSGFTLPSDQLNEKPTSLDASFVIDAGVTNNVFGIKRFTANLPRTAKAENVGTISGQIDLSNFRAPTGRIQLKSDALDITPIVAFLKPAKIQTEKQAAVKPASTLGQQQVTTNRFSFQQFKIGLDLKRLDWRDLVATNIVGRVELNNRKYTFSPVEMHLMGKPAMIEGYVVAASGSNTQYDLNISCENLPLNPIVRHFHPENKVEWGKLTANCYVKGEALRGELFKRTFHARGIDPNLPATLKIEGAKWGFKEDDRIVGLIAGPVFLDLPQLLNSHFNGAKLEITAGQGKVDFKLGAQGPLLIAATEGQGELGERFLDSKVNQYVEIALQQILAKKFFKLGIKKQNVFWPLPKGLLRLSGPIRRPKPYVNQFFVVQLVSQRLTGRSINLILGIPGILIGGSDKNIDGGKIDPFNLLDNQKERNQFNPLDILRLIPGID